MNGLPRFGASFDMFYEISNNGPGSGSEYTGSYGWEALQNTIVNRPDCSMKHTTWSFGIGAPGYAIVTGKTQSNT